MKLRESLSVLVDAKNHIDRWTSTAEDKDTNELRTAVHYLQRATNSYQAEVHDTQAASLLCGFHAALTSERFVYSAGWDYVREGFSARNEEYSPAARVVLCGAEAAGNNEDEDDDEDEDTVEIGKDSEWTRQRKEEEFGGMGVPGVARTYTNCDGEVVAVPMSIHYRYRGVQLARFNSMEYESCVSIVQRTAEQIAEWREQEEAKSESEDEAEDEDETEDEMEDETREQGGGKKEKEKKKKAGRRANAQVCTTDRPCTSHLASQSSTKKALALVPFAV